MPGFLGELVTSYGERKEGREKKGGRRREGGRREGEEGREKKGVGTGKRGKEKELSYQSSFSCLLFSFGHLFFPGFGRFSLWVCPLVLVII